jgi:hypothetical protein
MSGSFLFWLKLCSFVITAILGVVGVISDFRDEKTHKLTRSGRWNLTGLVLAAIIGVVAQKLENDQNRKASDKMTRDLEGLTRDNQDVLKKVGHILDDNSEILKTATESLNVEASTNQTTMTTLRTAQRNLEPAGDKISVGFHLEIPLDDPAYMGTAGYLQLLIANLIKKHSSGFLRDSYQTEHESIRSLSTKGGVQYTGIFDRESDLIPVVTRAGPLFKGLIFYISFYKTKPKIDDCYIAGHADAAYSWDVGSTDLGEVSNPISSTKFKTPVMSYDSTQNVIEQFPNYRAVFRQTQNMGGLVSTLDFSGLFMRVFEQDSYPVKFTRFDVKIGSRTFVVQMIKAKRDKCGGFLYRLPTF